MSDIATPRRKSLLEHFSTIKDDRQPCKVMYPLEEVLLLVVCGTMAACDDYDDIVLWGKQHLDFLRRLQPYHFGIPCADWLRVVMNRIGPDLFSSCFLGFVAERLPEAVGQIAIDGKTSRRSHDRGRGKAALHLVSAYATTHNLVLGQRAVADKSNEINAIPLLLEELAASGALAGSLVSIDAMGCQSDIAEKIVDLGGDYLLATKDNQKTAHAEIQLYFDTAPADEIDALILHDKGHGRIETRRHLVSQRVDWMSGSRRYPDEPRFKGLKTIAMIETRIETADEIKVERRCYISSRILSAEAFAHAARAHWAIENGLHWVLDVQFKEDQSRLRRGHGATNMAMVRHLALNLIRAIPGKLSIKARRKLATWDTQYLMAALQAR
ncbi:ISAs1 family transposase [Tistrella bauzanensis]|uniref:ISAs1 family transposase n=1 Tax=Tistrella bauzanensis TaxID=657419 RepID=A0ABQ1ICC9_9PROT|nr:ISAs1 family transposase [Tistrella bauzanensis]GGB34432.1 ISAs1 family transposase [Tistrella bauzanensis]